LSERPSGAFIWSGPPSSRQAAWSPPERPTPARTPQITAEDRPYRPTSPWAEPPSGLIDQEETGWA
jgi:hypothetical protein